MMNVKPGIGSLNEETLDFINLFHSLGDRAETFLPGEVYQSLKLLLKLSGEESLEPKTQKEEIQKLVLELKELIPGYVDVNLMLARHDNSKAFEYSSLRRNFLHTIRKLKDNELIPVEDEKLFDFLLNSHDFSIGTPPVTQKNIDFLNRIILGDEVRVLRKFRDLIGINDDIEEAQWNYMLDLFDQMIVQSTHYTTGPEKEFFLNRIDSTINFKGLNGLIRSLVSGTSQTALNLLSTEVLRTDTLKTIHFTNPEDLIEALKTDSVSVFAVLIPKMPYAILNHQGITPYLSRLIFIDDSPESQATNTCLVFAFHNGIINTLNKVHTKKMGAPANTQMNLRLILDKVNTESLKSFKEKIEHKISAFDQEIEDLKKDQQLEENNPEQEIILYKFDEFARQLIKDKYSLSKLLKYIDLIIKLKNKTQHKKLNKELIREFEERVRSYFYSGNEKLEIATVVEGGGRTQIKLFGEFLLSKKLKPVQEELIERCSNILQVIPDSYQRTLNNHFHKNFGINLFLEKYKAYLTKVENEADNQGRFKNFLIDLGIKDQYEKQSAEAQNQIKEFLSKLGTVDKTSVSDDVQMIIRDLLFWKSRQPNPYIYFIEEASWEYKDLFPPDRFDINPFDINIELFENGRIDYERLQIKLERIRDTFYLFDDTGSLWDRFCENTSFIINDPANPTGYTDFNNQALLQFLKFLNKTKISLFLDEAYSDSVKIDAPEEPKWRTISRYVLNNFGAFPNISMVSSLSTTKNLGATGERLGSLAATPARKDLILFAKKQYRPEQANTNSLYMLVNILEVAQLSKKIKVKMDENLPKDASRYKIKEKLEGFIIAELANNSSDKVLGTKINNKRISLFEGSPLHCYLLDELKSLDQLDILELPDDFKYKGEPFFSYFKDHLVKTLNEFRINKGFLRESGKRMKLAKKIANELIAENASDISYLDSDGSYLFNLHIKGQPSYHDLESFTKALAKHRGISLIPYRTGFVRFSLGGYLSGDQNSYDVFEKEIQSAIQLFLKYWGLFKQCKAKDLLNTEQTLNKLFPESGSRAFLKHLSDDFQSLSGLQKTTKNSLLIRDIKSIYLPSPKDSGVNINTIATSRNSVIELFESVGSCPDLMHFIKSKAFSKVYENLLPQIFRQIPAIRHLDVHTIIARYGKASLIKYINSKQHFLPGDHILDEPDELLIMKEILLELEKLLFSDYKVKLLALRVNEQDTSGDLARLEGYNQILRKYIQEILIHFNLPFDNRGYEPALRELISRSFDVLKENTGLDISIINKELLRQDISEHLLSREKLTDEFDKTIALPVLEQFLKEKLDSGNTRTDMENLYLLSNDDGFIPDLEQLIQSLRALSDGLDREESLMVNEARRKVMSSSLHQLWEKLMNKKNEKIAENQLISEARKIICFLTEGLNRTKDSTRYTRFNHILIKILCSNFQTQNSSVNQMIQHGYTLFTDFKMENSIADDDQYDFLRWINSLVEKCGVIGAEKDVQSHTRIATDAKKREFPFHKIDRTGLEPEPFQGNISDSETDFIKQLKTRPTAKFFGDRLCRFVDQLDRDDYRCKIYNRGLVRELYIFQKSYLKYLTDNYRLLGSDTISLQELKEFIPDIILFYGAPEKLLSYPRIGYFDLPGPSGNIKTLVTPLKRKVDYFGDIKKPRLTLMNEKVKEMGGMPVHGSLFAVEEDDGNIFVIQISGDSGVGKSEMLAAMILKWLRKNLRGVRSIKMIAGDMLHVFPDDKGDLYAIGTEIGDFSRVTDFDPDFIKQYASLFTTSADSNVEDLNSRSTISGLCDIAMPFKIDIMLTANNFSRDEAGIRRYANPENFVLYRESHGERKEKATSSDSPNLQRTLLRYTGDRQIVEVLSKHGGYLDEVFDWIKDQDNGRFYLGSSYRMIDKIDPEETINAIFKNKKFEKEGSSYTITHVKFDIVKNRFQLFAQTEEKEISFAIDRNFFSIMFNSLASTPSGNPFISEFGEKEIKMNLINILKGGEKGKGSGNKIQLGILSTDLGKQGKEITGPQKAADDLLNLIREVRLNRPGIIEDKQIVRRLIQDKYKGLIPAGEISMELFRYNFYLYQLEQMRKARFVRLDNAEEEVNLSNLKGFDPVPADKEFEPLLITPNLNTELSSYSETFSQLMWLPNIQNFANEFLESVETLYRANSYSRETNINNLMVQLLIKKGFLSLKDIARARLTEKINRETLAAAKWAVMQNI